MQPICAQSHVKGVGNECVGREGRWEGWRTKGGVKNWVNAGNGLAIVEGLLLPCDGWSPFLVNWDANVRGSIASCGVV